MAGGLIVALLLSGKTIFHELTLDNLHPKSLPMWPLMFITMACGAVSGFHATQSRSSSSASSGATFGFANQALATLVLWAVAAWLIR